MNKITLGPLERKSTGFVSVAVKEFDFLVAQEALVLLKEVTVDRLFMPGEGASSGGGRIYGKICLSNIPLNVSYHIKIYQNTSMRNFNGGT
jgi:hypothetical protein